MSEFVRIPRAVITKWWRSETPWAEVLAAAEAGEDGLSVEGPPYTPQLSEPPREENFRLAGGEVDRARFEEASKKYQRGIDAAYLHAGSGHWFKDKACLFQQNW